MIEIWPGARDQHVMNPLQLPGFGAAHADAMRSTQADQQDAGLPTCRCQVAGAFQADKYRLDFSCNPVCATSCISIALLLLLLLLWAAVCKFKHRQLPRNCPQLHHLGGVRARSKPCRLQQEAAQQLPLLATQLPCSIPILLLRTQPECS
jgi:hypothetical protein